MHCRCADAHLHYLKGIYLETVYCMEPFAASMLRNLSQQHPLFCLLRPHFRGLLSVANVSRETVTGPGGIAETIFSLGPAIHKEFMPKMYAEWRFEHMSLTGDLARRGLLDQV